MAKSPIRKFMRRRKNNYSNYTLYGIIAGVAALLAVAMLVYPRYDRIQNLLRGRNNPMRERDLETGRYKKSRSSLPRGRAKTNSAVRSENEILEAGRTRLDNL